MAASLSSSVKSLVSLVSTDEQSVKDNSTKVANDSDYKFAAKKRGDNGTKCKVFANFAPVNIRSKTIVYQYNIEINLHDQVQHTGDFKIPQRNRIKQQKKIINDLNFEIFSQFVQDEFAKKEESIFTSHPVFDGKKTIFSKTKLRLNDRMIKSVKLKVPERKIPTTFEIKITTPKDSHKIDLSILSNKKNLPSLRSAEKELQALDIILTYGAKKFNLFYNSNMFKRKDDLYTLTEQERNKIRFNIGSLKEGSFGSYQACKLTENGIQLNVDRVAMVFNKGGKLLDIIESFLAEKRSRRENQRRNVQLAKSQDRVDERLSDYEIRMLSSELRGLSFYTDHVKCKNVIRSLTNKTVSEETFLLDGKQISVKDYFENKYKDYIVKLGRPLLSHMPCVQVGTKSKKTLFPVEVVHIIEDQYCMKKLDTSQQAIMTIICGQQSPIVRFSENRNQISALLKSSERFDFDYLKYFGIKLTARFSEIEARILNLPKICGTNNVEKRILTIGGEWTDAKFAIAAKLNSNSFKWMVINFAKEFQNEIRNAPDKNQIDDLIEKIVSVCKENGLKLNRPSEIRYKEVYNGKLELEDFFYQCTMKHNGLKLMLLLLPENDELYAQIKFLSEIQFGFVTQCIGQRKVKKFGEKSYTQNIALKINAKLGGINCHIKSESKVGFLNKKTMIMGLDITHPSVNDRIANSIASVIATFDNNFVNYFSKTLVQPKPRLEIVDLEDITIELLNNFFKKHGSYPSYILVYRDGVSEGQFNQVIQKEINMMRKAFAEINLKMHKENNMKKVKEIKECNPKLTFIIVQKRHHTRFLPVNESDGDLKSKNVKPGLIVDNGIVSNFFHDFYLVSHRGFLGTSRPTRYIVLHDESEFTGNEIQLTTYYLSHLFPSCMKVISLPPPILFSHLCAKRVRLYLLAMNKNRDKSFGGAELNGEEIEKLNKQIQVKDVLQNILYFI